MYHSPPATALSEFSWTTIPNCVVCHFLSLKVIIGTKWSRLETAHLLMNMVTVVVG